MKTLTTIAIVAAAVTLFACDKPEERKAAQDPTANATTTTTAANPSPPSAAQPKPDEAPIADSDLATPADFETEAETAITKKNYKPEIALLETEMSKE